SFQGTLAIPVEGFVAQRNEEESLRADAHDVSIDEISARLDLRLVHIGSVRRVVIHEDEATLLRAKDEIGVMRRGLIVIDDDVGAAVAPQDVATDADGIGLAAGRAGQADQPSDHEPRRWCRGIELLRRDGAFHRRLPGLGSGPRSGRRRRWNGHRPAWLRIGGTPVGCAAVPVIRLSAESRRPDDGDLCFAAVRRTVGTEVPRLVDEVSVFTSLISHDVPQAWKATATAFRPPK